MYETEADCADVIVDTDSDDDQTECFPESVRRREGMTQKSNEVEGSVSEPSTEREIDSSNLSQLNQIFQFRSCCFSVSII
jgi:hypothetical protein